MESSPAKRRKLDHQADQPGSNGLSPSDDAPTAATSVLPPSSFVLQTQELLAGVRVNHEKVFSGADDLLHRIKSAIEAIEPQAPTPVSNSVMDFGKPLVSSPSALLLLTMVHDYRSIKRRPSFRKSMMYSSRFPARFLPRTASTKCLTQSRLSSTLSEAMCLGQL